MKFGLFGGATAKTAPPGSPTDGEQAPDRVHFAASDDSHAYGELIDGIVEAERLGFHGVFLVEHHFTGVGQLSATLGFLSFLAARTQAIRLGTAVIVLPWHNPVLLAEQVATLDVLSNGRLDFGIGRGYRPTEFDRFRIPLEEAGERFEEAIALLKKALTSEQRFSHRSQHWAFDDIVVEPPPVQRPHPPLWLAAGRPESLRKAAEDGYSLLLDQFATLEVTLERLAIYRAAIEDAGQAFDPMRVAVARSISILGDEGDREAAMERRMAAVGRMGRLARSDDGAYVSSMAPDPDLRKAAEESTLMGTPERIIEQIEMLRAGGVEYLLLAGTGADPATLRRFAREVMPAFPAT